MWGGYHPSTAMVNCPVMRPVSATPTDRVVSLDVTPAIIVAFDPVRMGGILNATGYVITAKSEFRLQ